MTYKTLKPSESKSEKISKERKELQNNWVNNLEDYVVISYDEVHDHWDHTHNHTKNILTTKDWVKIFIDSKIISCEQKIKWAWLRLPTAEGFVKKAEEMLKKYKETKLDKEASKKEKEQLSNNIKIWEEAVKWAIEVVEKLNKSIEDSEKDIEELKKITI